MFVTSPVVDCVSLSRDLQENRAAAAGIAHRRVISRPESWQCVS